MQDVNDNWPVFSPSEYNVSIVWSSAEQGPIVTVRAKDLDSGSFGVVSYYLISAKGKYLNYFFPRVILQVYLTELLNRSIIHIKTMSYNNIYI